MKFSKLDMDFLTDVTNIIEEHLNLEKFGINYLANKMNMSHSTFFRKIKGLTGVSANEYIRKIRLKNSLQLIISGKHNIS